MTNSRETTALLAPSPSQNTEQSPYINSPLNYLENTLPTPQAELTTLRGRLAKNSQSTLVAPSHDNPEISQQLTQIFSATLSGNNPPNLGADIKALIPTLERNPALLKQLTDIATAESLFGINKTDPNVTPERFEEMRREFLRAIISKAANYDSITSGQGETSTCCAAAALNGRFITPSQYLELSCGLALNSSFTFNGGVTIGRSPDLSYAEKISGTALFSDSKLLSKPRSVNSVSNPLPTFGEALVNASLVRAFGGSTEDGMQAEQYTRMLGAMSGKELACIDGEQRFQIDTQTGNYTNTGGREVSALEYIDSFLDRNSGQGVLVDLKWCDADKTSGSQRHGRHLLSVVNKVQRDDGEYLVLLNPIGDSVYTDSSSGKELFYPPGHKLGDPSKRIWWLVGDKPGEVLVRRDVFEQNLQTVLVETGAKFNKDKEPILIGIPEDAPAIEWITSQNRGGGAAASPSGSSLTQVPGSGDGAEQGELAGVAIAKWMEAQAIKRAKEVALLAGGNSFNIKPLSVIAQYDNLNDKMYESNPNKGSKGDNQEVRGFFSDNQQGTSRAVPPPPPPGNPDTKAA
jgi:hypothetical protein